MKGRLRSFEQLECWQACTEVRRFVMGIVRTFPPHERFSLADDMTRASRSCTHNIAEGFGRYYFQENIQFCRQARGSLQELIDQLVTARDEGYISQEAVDRGRALIGRALALLNGYINYLWRAKNQ